MSLLDPKWKYTHSTATDIRKTFAKARRDLAKKERADVRTPKLQLMRGPVPSPISYNSPVPSAVRHGMRSIDEDAAERRNLDAAHTRADSRMASR